MLPNKVTIAVKIIIFLLVSSADTLQKMSYKSNRVGQEEFPFTFIFDKRFGSILNWISNLLDRKNHKAYEILGIDVSRQKASKLLGDPLEGWPLTTSQQRAQENIARRVQKNSGISRKALQLLGIKEKEVQNNENGEFISRSPSVISLRTINFS